MRIIFGSESILPACCAGDESGADEALRQAAVRIKTPSGGLCGFMKRRSMNPIIDARHD